MYTLAAGSLIGCIYALWNFFRKIESYNRIAVISMDESIRHNKILYEMSEANNREDQKHGRANVKVKNKRKKILQLDGEAINQHGA